MNRTSRTAGQTIIAVFAVVALLPAVALTQTTAVHAAAHVNSAGKIVKGGVVVIEADMIARVGGEVPSGVPVHAYPGAVVCPGLIDCHAALGAEGNLSERREAIEPRAHARDAFDRFSGQLQAALAAGVTTFALTPDDQNLVGGRIAICQTSGPERQPRVLTDAGPLKLSLAPSAFKVDREPTSRGGAVGLLRDTIEKDREAGATDDPLGLFARGELRGFFAAPSGADVLAALGLARDYGLQLVLIHTRDARLVAESAAGQVAGVIVGPLELTTSRREALAAGIFERHGVPVALAGGLPARPPDSLRIGAAIAARAGLSAPAARRAITTAAAELLGVEDRIGVLEPGRQADLVVFSGDPLDLRSRVLAVYVGGQRVYVADAESARGERP